MQLLIVLNTDLLSLRLVLRTLPVREIDIFDVMKLKWRKIQDTWPVRAGGCLVVIVPVVEHKLAAQARCPGLVPSDCSSPNSIYIQLVHVHAARNDKVPHTHTSGQSDVWLQASMSENVKTCPQTLLAAGPGSTAIWWSQGDYLVPLD